ncbi:glycosyltransferase family 4 protein [Saccharicrinis aurantiacus]|uniref:glycosyltransferase family 4 protein n=1 Tax=Saccharicrinis aurantiacus TaxID=1849719 RepID=UPI00095010D8|nr:glycosyltransferase family 4 protein [Saccharicrinis aurantiacus]
MKIGYINGGIGVSETFVYNLVYGIRQKNKNTTFICAKKPYYIQGICYKVIPYTYYAPPILANICYNLGQRGKNIIWNKKQKTACKALESHLMLQDVLFIEYGTNAVQLLPTLNKIQKPYIVHFHGYDITSALSDTYYKEQLQCVFSNATYLIAASHHIRKLLVLAGASNDKIKVVRLGVEKSIISNVLWDIRNKNKAKRVIFVGRLTPKKHPIALIKAFELVYQSNKNTHLDIIGDGPLLTECKKLIEKLKLQEVITLHGSLKNEEALHLMQEAYLYAQHSITAPSGDQEGFAISLAEAALFELPVVSTLHNGIPENVKDGETGYLVKEFDFEAMAEKILILLNNPTLAEEMGKKGRAHIIKLCDPNKRIDIIYELLKNAATK